MKTLYYTFNITITALFAGLVYISAIAAGVL